MRIDKIEEKNIEITLSERNLQTLLEKLTWDSARTIQIQSTDGTLLTVHSESNETHYANRSAGIMLNKDGKIY